MEIINKILWSITIYLLLLNSIYYSVKLKFPQLQIKKIPKKNKKRNEISSKDTIIMSLSSKIGVGSLSGTSIMIYYGGLGTIFWIWVGTFFLSIITYIENALGTIYKDKKTNTSSPSNYIKIGLNKPKLSNFYALLIILAYSIIFPSIQANTITILTSEELHIKRIYLSLIIIILTLPPLLKGINKISKICNKIFPVMMFVYITTGIIIIIKNINIIPSILSKIIINAFNTKEIGISIAYMIVLTMQKNIFANESGVGTSAIISGASNENYINQANAGIIQTYFINMVVITITAFIIGTSNYNDIRVINGIELTKYAFIYHFPNIGNIVLTLIGLLFSYSTIITIYYYAESSLNVFTKKDKYKRILKLITIISIFYGGITNAYTIWKAIDIIVALLSIINLYSIYKLKDIVIQKLTIK